MEDNAESSLLTDFLIVSPRWEYRAPAVQHRRLLAIIMLAQGEVTPFEAVRTPAGHT